jgi:hypothetical protein
MRETTGMKAAGMQDMRMDKTGLLVKTHTTIVEMRKAVMAPTTKVSLMGACL